MLKRPITYETFDEVEVTEFFYFNISKPEIIDMEVEHKQGFRAMIEQIINTEDRQGLVEQFKKLILMAYGERSEDGKRFIKSDELRKEFSQTAAYISLFMELATVDGAGAEFLIAVLPRDLRGEINVADLMAQMNTPTPSTPPTPPTSPTPPLPPIQPAT